MSTPASHLGTVIIYGPFFARSGFGVLARGTAMGLHLAGLKVRIVPVDCDDKNATETLDDVNIPLFQTLRHTPVTGPVTAIFAYVPTYCWPKVSLPEPSQRIMLTTFDSSANAAQPPSRQIFICNQMDQVWVANETEKQAWIKAGIDPTRIHAFNWAHEWIDNPQLGPVVPRGRSADTPFRFLHISLLLPRRRLDVLIRAFFEEFQQADEAELYLKMSYPSWHPTPGKPKADLSQLIEQLRRETGSLANVIVDEELGSRKDLARLIDSGDAYVSSDTTVTAPVTEAIVRERPVIITDGWGVDLPPEAIVVPNSQERVEITPTMAEYMPHQKGASFPALKVSDMRHALRKMVAMKEADRRDLATKAGDYMRQRYSYAATAPVMIQLMQAGWNHRRSSDVPSVELPQKFISAPVDSSSRPINLHWGGLQLFFGKIPRFNREVAHELINRGHHVSLSPGNGIFHIEELDVTASAQYRTLAKYFHEVLPGPADINVSCRWHPIFNEQPATRQILATTWWSGTIPQDWLRPIAENVDELWVPSQFVRENFIASGINSESVQVIPMGIDPDVFQPHRPRYRLKTGKSFTFLFVGETSRRRGLDVLLSAYAKAFTSQDDVCLVIKDMNCRDYSGILAAQKFIAEFQTNPRFPEIEYIPQMLTDGELASLYGSCDCFVQPHRTASASLAALEAMACGLPVIATHFGGVKDFATDANAYLIPAKMIRQRPANVGHWRVTGEQFHAEVNLDSVIERMRHVYKHKTEAQALGIRASEAVRQKFTWKNTADLVEQRMRAVMAAEPRRSVTQVSAPQQPAVSTSTGPTVVMFAPFYNRSGYGVAARALAAAWHAAGLKIRIAPVNNVEDGVDDCDLDWLRSLEKTPVNGPVIAVFFHVAAPAWLTVSLPPGSRRILYTTFDGTAQGTKPPTAWIDVCKQMDQLWLQTEKEAEVFAAAGVPRAKIEVLKCPHPWIQNPVLPVPAPKPASARFRFLSVAMFLPRRRWDTLIEAFLTEFKTADGPELYLKVNYPDWHPVPGQPARDLRALIHSLRKKTGSAAPIILDDDLGTRLGICRLMDSCDVYVSTDTTITAPVGEAFVREKIVVLPDGFGAKLPYQEGALVIPVDPKLTTPMTDAMRQYQPHHTGCDLPLLRVENVRLALRSAYDLPATRRQEMGRQAAARMDYFYGPAAVTPAFIKALSKAAADDNTPFQGSPVSVSWEGSFLDHGSLSHVNRELVSALKPFSHARVQCVSHAKTAAKDAASIWPELAQTMASSSPSDVALTVRHAWPPNWTRPRQGKLAVIQPWEFGSLPSDWVAKSRDVDEFWVPTEYVRRVYIESGVPANKVFVVPNGVNPEVFHPQVKPMRLETKKKFKFLFVGGTIGRKGPDLLLQAYINLFTAADDVCLVIKDFGGNSVYQGQTFEAQIRKVQSLPNAPEILYLNMELPPEELPGLYTACDCLVLSYRGEGFGLPVLEAMACGLSVIVTAGGATDDFVRDEFGWRVPATRNNFGRKVSGMPLAGQGWLLEPNLAELGARMRYAFLNPAENRERGKLASRHAHERFTWKHSAQAVARRIQVLATSPGDSPQPESIKAPVPPPFVASVGRLDEARELFAQKKLPGAWLAAGTALAHRPYHPEALLLLAEIALAAGNGQIAKRCAKLARDLAPGWKAAKKFLSQPFKDGAQVEWLQLPKAMDHSGAKTHRLSVCLITKNEERFLAQCLKSVRDVASQIIVMDTGSTDRTVEIAREFGAEVYAFKWCDDFSTARNAALEHATGDWILILDADEELPADQHAKLHADLNHANLIGYRLPLINCGQENEGIHLVPRLFRNAPGIYYRGRIHEQVFSSLLPLAKDWGLKTGQGTARLLHHGYTAEMTRDRNKVERNLKLLEQAVLENPNDPNLLMNLGLELVRSEKLELGIEKYRLAFQAMSAQPAVEVVPELREVMLTQFTSHLYKLRLHQEVVDVLTSPLAKLQSGLTASLHFALGLAHFELKQFSEAADQMRQCLAKRSQTTISPINTDIHTAAPQHCLALSLAKQDDATGAEKAFAAALGECGNLDAVKVDYAKFLAERGQEIAALETLHSLVTQNPSNATAWRTGGQIALSKVDFLEFASDWTAAAFQALSQDTAIAAQRAEALLLTGDTTNALPLWKNICQRESSPQGIAAQILCETVESVTSSVATEGMDEPAVSRAFISWYQKLIAMQAQSVIARVNNELEELSRVLPTASGMLEEALNDSAVCA